LAGSVHRSWRHSGTPNAYRYGKINDVDGMPVAYEDGMQKVLAADDIPARIRTFVSKVSNPAAGVA